MVPNTVHMNQAQHKLRPLKLWLGAQELIAEVALDEKEVATGMMFRKQIADNEGMLFVFNRPHRASFYMKNTTVPLSCAYIDSEGVILEIHDLQPLNEKPVVAGSSKVQFVLETQQGWFAKNNVTTGMVVRAEQGLLRQVFTRAPRQ